MDQEQPSAVQIMQQLVEVKQDHPAAYPAALQHTLEMFGGMQGFLQALQSEAGSAQPGAQQQLQATAAQPPQQQVAPAKPAPVQQKAPPSAPPIKAPAPPATGFGMSQGPRFNNGPTTPDKIASGLMAGMPVGQARGNAMAAHPSFASGGSVTPPPGATPEEVADNVPINVSPDETIIPADVSKWWGQHTFEDMREQAKAGFAKMVQEGRLKGSSGDMGGGQVLPNASPVDGFADGGMDLGSALEGQQLMAGARPMQEPDADTGKPTGFASGGAIDPSAVYVGPNEEVGGSDVSGPDNATQGGGPTADGSSYGGSRGLGVTPGEAAKAAAIGAAGFGLSAVGLGAVGTLAKAAYSTYQDLQNVENPSIGDVLSAAAHTNPVTGFIANQLGFADPGAAAKAADQAQTDQEHANQAAQDQAEGQSNRDAAAAAGTGSFTAADQAQTDQEHANQAAQDQAEGQSNRDASTNDSGGNDNGGSGGGNSEGGTGGGSGGGAGEGGDSGNAATGGFITNKPKMKRINPDNMRKANEPDKALSGGFVESRASVRKITNRGIKVPKIL